MTILHPRRDVLAILACGPFLLGSAKALVAQPAGQSRPEPVARSFTELKSRIKPGATIFITDSAGREVSGRLSELSDTSLNLLLADKRQAFMQADVGLVRQRQPDSLWNGLLIGMAAGVTPAVYWWVADPNECGNSVCMDDLTIGVVEGALIGLAIDAAIKRKVVVYRSQSSSSTGAVTVAPIVAGRRQGLALTMSFGRN